MIHMRTEKGLSRSQPLGIGNALRNNAAHLLRLLDSGFVCWLSQCRYNFVRPEQKFVLPIQCRRGIYRIQDTLFNSPMYSHAANIIPPHNFSNTPKFGVVWHLLVLLTPSRHSRQEGLCYICANDTTKPLILEPYHVTIVMLIHMVHSYKRDNDMKHHIYTLSDPRDGSIRYVGMSQNAFKRYGSHLLGTGTDGKEKTDWIEELLANEMLPILTIIDRVEGRKAAFAEETRWIKKLEQEGTVLLNKNSIVRRELTNPEIGREAIRQRIEQLENARKAARERDAVLFDK